MVWPAVAPRGGATLSPALSVLMPAYEADATLPEAVGSVLGQTVEDIELIVVDDGSPTPAADVLGDVADARLRVIRRPRNGGTAAARRDGLGAARAPLVAQLDADDLWESEYVESVLPEFEDPAVGLVYSDATIVGHPDGRRRYIQDAAIHPLDRFPGLAAWNPIPSPTVAMRAAAVRAVGGYARWLRSTEDYHLYLRLAAAGWRFAYVDRPLARYRWPSRDRGKSGRERWHRGWEVAMRAAFAARHPRVPGAARAIARTSRRLVRGRMPARTPLAYALGAYPQLSETFVLEELRELARQTTAPPVVAMFRGDGCLDDAPTPAYLCDTTPAQRTRASLMLLALHPLRTLACVALPSRRMGASLADLFELAPWARGLAGVRHIHAHFATDPATNAARLAALTGAGFSFTAHAYDIWLVRDRLDEKLAAASLVVTCSDANRRELESLPGGRRGTVHRVYQGIDIERFRRRGSYAPDGPLLVVARLVPKKGVDVLLAALALGPRGIPPVVIVGDGSERERLEELAGGVAAPVELLGARPHTEISALMERASAFVLPSVVLPDGDRDAVPTVLLEAMAMELPVVSTRIAGIDEVVADDRGLLVPQRDSEALAAALERLYALPAPERTALGRAGRRYVAANHDVRTQVGELRRLLAAAGAL